MTGTSHTNKPRFAKTIVVVLSEGDSEAKRIVEAALQFQGYAVRFVRTRDEALHSVQRERGKIYAVLIDTEMCGKNVIDTLRDIRKCDRSLPVIVLSRSTKVPDIVKAMKSGATDVLSAPPTYESLNAALTRAVSTNGNAPNPCENALPPADFAEAVRVSSLPIENIETMLTTIAASDVPVLIEGETGVGKEVMARRIHAQSTRAEKPFLKLNCAALPSELVESELFGYERGAFTGAFERKPGIFEMADAGTILLDEIGDMTLRLQSKLLHVLQDSEFHRLGGKDVVRVNVRVIAATHCNLKAAMNAQRFREDLYYRLNVVSFRIPPLRNRKEDILPLAEFLLRKHANGNAPPQLSPDLREALTEYDWPGNIRELENIIRRLLVLRDASLILQQLREEMAEQRPDLRRIVSDLKPSCNPAHNDVIPPLEQVNEAKIEAERVAIVSALNSTRWNRKQAASLLNIDYKALLYKMKKLGLEARRGPVKPATKELFRVAANG